MESSSSDRGHQLPEEETPYDARALLASYLLERNMAASVVEIMATKDGKFVMKKLTPEYEAFLGVRVSFDNILRRSDVDAN
jgi:hypothetical protein